MRYTLRFFKGRKSPWCVRWWVSRKQKTKWFTEEADARAYMDCRQKQALTVELLRDRWLEDRKRRKLRPFTLKTYEYQSNYIVKAFGRVPVSRLNPAKVEQWLYDLKVCDESKKDIRGVANCIWRHSDLKPLMPKYPWLYRRRDDREIDFYTLPQVCTLLNEAPESFRLYLAFGLFAGLRPLEIERLHPSDIKETGILVRGASSKTGMSRFVSPVEPTWAQFARACPFRMVNIRKQRQKLCDDTGVPWIKDGLRHTFATYYYAKHGPSGTAQVLGHRSLDMLYRHYAGITTKEEACRYFMTSFAGAR